MKKIYLASDHGGFELKNILAEFLVGEGYTVVDMGPQTLEPGDDYPDYIFPLAHTIASEEGALGVIFGLSGQGEAMAANRVSGCRAAVYYGGQEDILVLSREHNNANILSLGAHFLTEDIAKRSVYLWLNAKFSGEERHVRRINKLDHAA